VDDVAQKIPASANLDEVYLFNAGKNQRDFIDVFGAQVWPELRAL
jgi:hypothetical protein